MLHHHMQIHDFAIHISYIFNNGNTGRFVQIWLYIDID